MSSVHSPRAGSKPAQQSNKSLPRTAAFGRLAIARFVSAQTREGLAQAHARLFPDKPYVLRSNEVPGGATSGTWAGELAQDSASGEFLSAVNYVSVDGQLLRYGATDVPANRNLGVLDGYFAAGVLAEGDAIPLHEPSYANVAVDPIKIAALAVITNDLVRRGNGVAVVGTGLRDAMARATDTALLSTSAYGLRYGIAASGDGAGDSDEVDFQIAAMLNTGLASADLASTVLVCTPAVATALAIMRNSVTGMQAYPAVTVTGGTLAGLPLVVSAGAPAATLTALDAAAIVRSDLGVSIEVSSDATIEMASDPAGSITTPTAQAKQKVNLFQNEAKAVKAIRVIGWKAKRSGSVAWLSNFAPGTAIATT